MPLSGHYARFTEIKQECLFLSQSWFSVFWPLWLVGLSVADGIGQGRGGGYMVWDSWGPRRQGKESQVSRCFSAWWAGCETALRQVSPVVMSWLRTLLGKGCPSWAWVLLCKHWEPLTGSCLVLTSGFPLAWPLCLKLEALECRENRCHIGETSVTQAQCPWRTSSGVTGRASCKPLHLHAFQPVATSELVSSWTQAVPAHYPCV